MNKLLSVEWLRGAAALGVCIMHIFCAFEFFSKDELFFQTYIFPIAIAGRIGVAVFFVISGFIIPYSMYQNKYRLGNIGKFLLRRFARLEPPYLFSIVLALVTMAAVAWIRGLPFTIDWAGVALHLGYLNVFFQKPWLCGVYWSLAIEFQYYLLIACLYPLLVHPKPAYRLLFFAGTLVAALFTAQHTSEFFIFDHMPFFLMGIACFLQKVNLITTRTFLLKLAILALIIFIFHHKANAVLSTLAAVLIFVNLDIRWKPMYYLGKISYSLYLFHWIVGIEVLRYLYQFYYPNPSETHKIVFCSLSVAVCIVFSDLTYRFVEAPSIRLSKRIRYAKPKPLVMEMA
jgi:peptidoglycan/LPS O-acetylase OafA/YrhL